MSNWQKLSWARREGSLAVDLDKAVTIRMAPGDDRYQHKGQVTRISFSEGSQDYIDVVEGFDVVAAMIELKQGDS